ncbi:MAG: hypothetical protein IKF78_08290 [Atopobiaceae bacterium]|nr:hypothetical protein [Atopobiaceae bacterium]
MENEKPLGARVGESVFCVCYLVFALVAGICFARAAGDAVMGTFATTCAAMTFLLGCGDAFHLVPRVVINIQGEARGDEERRHRNLWLGVGNLVSSITMTLFYLLLFRAMAALGHSASLASPAGANGVYAVLCLLAVVRVVLCLMPANHWFDGRGSGAWGLYRNIPFVAMGAITAFYLVAWYGEWLLALLVCASFACYMAVVTLAHKKPAMGMLMIPKTLCYIALIALLLARL